jgi:hypothetical protein
MRPAWRIGQIAHPGDLLAARRLHGAQLSMLRRALMNARSSRGEPAKSYGEQETFAADTTDEPFCKPLARWTNRTLKSGGGKASASVRSTRWQRQDE